MIHKLGALYIIGATVRSEASHQSNERWNGDQRSVGSRVAALVLSYRGAAPVKQLNIQFENDDLPAL